MTGERAKSAPDTDVGILAVSVHSHRCQISPQMCTWQWTSVTEVRIVACRCTAGGAAGRGQSWGIDLHLALEQPLRPGLAASVDLRVWQGQCSGGKQNQ